MGVLSLAAGLTAIAGKQVNRVIVTAIDTLFKTGDA